jgi:putative RecB family exonuclease
MTLPEHVSHSQLTSWAERCQKAWELKRIRGAPEVPAWWLVGGSTVHEVTEELDRRGLEFGLTPAAMNVTLEIEELTLLKLNELAAKTAEKSGVPESEWFTAGRGKGQGREYWEENAPTMVSNWLTWRTRVGWEIAFFEDDDEIDHPMIELDLESFFRLNLTLEVDAETKVVGAPDRVMVLPNGELVIVDVKSGSSTPKTQMQQGLYATLLELLGHRRPRYGTFVKVKEPDGVHTTLAPLAKYDERFFTQMFGAFRAQLETGMFLPNVGDNCRTCGVQAACYAASGSLSHEYDPLDPNYQGAK